MDNLLLFNMSSHDLRHRNGYRMIKLVPLHRLVQNMSSYSNYSTMLYIRTLKQDLQHEVENRTGIVAEDIFRQYYFNVSRTVKEDEGSDD